MGIINSISMLAIILSGAAIIREREHGTMDHLLVMPVTPFEIAMSKVWANGLVIAVACRPVALYRGAHNPRYSDRGLGVAVHGRRCHLPLFCYGGRRFSRHSGAVDAAARTSLHAGLPADEHAVGGQHPPREHAAMAEHGNGGVAFDPFRIVRSNRSSIAALGSRSSGRNSSLSR